MILLPFIYFSLLAFYLYRRQGGMTVAVYMAMLYAFTGLCALATTIGGYLGEDGGILYDNNNAEFGVIPTVLYCGIITATIMPFTRFNTARLEKTPVLVNGLVLDLLGVFIIAMSLLNLYLVADSTMDILTGDFAELRESHNSGEESLAQLKAQSMPYVSYIYLLNNVCVFGLPLSFYNFSQGRRPWWFNTLLLLASLSEPLAGIQSADRTEATFFGLMALFTLILFWHEVTTRFKVVLAIVSLPIVAAIAIYLAMVSNDRFEKTYGGPAISVMQYVGQGYINFCYFWDYAKSDYISTEREFPLYNRITTGTVSDGDRRNVRSAEQGFFISVFPTFIGDIMLDLTFPGMVLWIIVFIAICHRVIPDTSDPDTEVHASDYLVVFLLGIVPTFGIFYYRFYNFKSTLMIKLVIAVILLSRYAFSLSAPTDEDNSDNSNL